MNDSGKFFGRKFLLEYHVASLNVDSLQEILSKQGYTVIEFNHLQNTAAVEQLLKALHLTETAARLKGFTYRAGQKMRKYLKQIFRDIGIAEKKPRWTDMRLNYQLTQRTKHSISFALLQTEKSRHMQCRMKSQI